MQDAVARLTCLSTEERRRLNSFSIEECDSGIRGLVNQIHNPDPHKSLHIPDIVEHLALLYQRKAELQAHESEMRLLQLQRVNDQLICDNAELQEKIQLTQSQDPPTQLTESHNQSPPPEEEECMELTVSVNLPAASSATSIRVESQPTASPEREAALRRELEAVPSAGQPHPNRGDLEATQSAVFDTNIHSGVTTWSQTTYCHGVRAPAPHHHHKDPSFTSYAEDSRLPPLDGHLSSGPTRSSMHFGETATPYLQAPRGASSLGPPPTGESPHPSSFHFHRPKDPQSYPHRDRAELSSDNSDSACSHRGRGLCIHEPESLVRDIERLDPNNREVNSADYLPKVERRIPDPPSSSTHGKLKLLEEAMSMSAHRYIESLHPNTRDWYPNLCQAPRDRCSLYHDPATATFCTCAIIQRKSVPPRECYRCLRVAHLQGRTNLGQEEDQAVKSTFVKNLHNNMRFDVALFFGTAKPTMKELRRHAQMVGKRRQRQTGQKPEGDARVLKIQATGCTNQRLESHELPPPKATAKGGSKRCPLPRQQSGQPSQKGAKPGGPGQQNPQQKRGPDPSPQWESKSYEKHQNRPKEDDVRSQLQQWVKTCMQAAIQGLNLPPSRGQDPGPPSA